MGYLARLGSMGYLARLGSIGYRARLGSIGYRARLGSRARLEATDRVTSGPGSGLSRDMTPDSAREWSYLGAMEGSGVGEGQGQ